MKNATGLSTEDADLLVENELATAGIEPIAIPIQGEVRASVGGNLEVGGYVFRLRRAWVYWSAVDAPYDGVQTHHSGHGTNLGSVVRAGGYNGGQDSSELGDGVTHWHIDTQKGLNAFARWIKENLR